MSSEFVVNLRHESNHSSPFRFILSYVFNQPITALVLVLGAFSNAALASAVPIFLGDAFAALQTVNEQTIAGVTAAAIGIFVSQTARSLLQFSRNIAAEVFAQRIERDVRDELYASLLGKSMTFHDLQPVGEIMARVTNDVREMNLMMNPGVNLLIGAGMFLIMPGLAAPQIHPELVLVPLGFIIAHLIVQVRFVRQLHPIAQEVRASFGKMNARLAESLEGLQVVKGAAQEDNEAERF